MRAALILSQGNTLLAAVLALASDLVILWFLVNVLGWNYLITATHRGSCSAVSCSMGSCVAFVFPHRRRRESRRESCLPSSRWASSAWPVNLIATLLR